MEKELQKDSKKSNAFKKFFFLVSSTCQILFFFFLKSIYVNVVVVSDAFDGNSESYANFDL